MGTLRPLRRVIACSLVSRALVQLDTSAPQQQRVQLMGRVLQQLTPCNAGASWLLLRVLLDEQV